VSQTIVVYPTTGSTVYEREMSNPPMLLLEYGPPLLCRFIKVWYTQFIQHSNNAVIFVVN